MNDEQIRHLQAEVERLKDALAEECAANADAEAAANAARTELMRLAKFESAQLSLDELDALRADAERYRWLRDRCWKTGSIYDFSERIGADEWDARIDMEIGIDAARASDRGDK